MSQPSYTPDRSESLRQETIALLQNLAEKARAFALPFPEALEQYRLTLLLNSYKVLVVGEAKRGKSTFVNALIGRDILPTDVDIATSQIFHVCRSEHEAYRLRFEDDSTREIMLADLPRYGVQGVAQAPSMLPPHQVIRWIEVEGPACFLPEGVSIIDTPGLGSLYAAHAQITYRFVPQADAVIFVLDSEQPLVQTEIDFINTILGVTRDIFFIQTKIDLFGTAHWQSILQRNREILRERFHGRLVGPRIWPISSTLLRQAAYATKHAEALLLAAHHEELAAALQAFLFRATGWRRSAEALLLANQYHTDALQTLSVRLGQLAEEFTQQGVALQRRTAGLGQQFNAEWGEHGDKRQVFHTNIRELEALGKQRFARALSVRPPGKICETFMARIAELRSLKEAERCAEQLPGEVAAMALEEWHHTCTAVLSSCAAALAPFQASANTLTFRAEGHYLIEAEQLQDLVLISNALENKSPLWSMVKGAAMGTRAVVEAVDIAIGLLPVLAPVVSVVMAPALLVSLVCWGIARFKTNVKAAQHELEDLHLTDALQQVRKYFFDEDLTLGYVSRVDAFFTTLERKMFDQVQVAFQQTTKKARAELDRLMEVAHLDALQRTAARERTQQQISTWDQLGKTKQSLLAQLSALEGL